jgi:hypothetical protein
VERPGPACHPCYAHGPQRCFTSAFFTFLPDIYFRRAESLVLIYIVSTLDEYLEWTRQQRKMRRREIEE